MMPLTPLEKQLRDALKGVTTMYVELADSGDCGFWEPEEVGEIVLARAALAAAREKEK